jgi:hypothetical protein
VALNDVGIKYQMSLKPEERLDLEAELVEKLGREGYCSVACRIIHEFRSDGLPWVITDSETDERNAHFFLFDNRFAIDIGGADYTKERLLKIIDTTDEGLIAKPTEWPRIYHHERSLRMCPEEKEIVEQRFREHILRHQLLFQRPPEKYWKYIR